MPKNILLREVITDILTRHLEAQKDYLPNNLYEEVIREVEKPLINVVMRHTQGNISQAAEILGISRATLRKKQK
tara:strand:+ start:222 stop:443 length:222 start_codon:yes stop_codon:yes gene_type:complete